MFQKGAIWSSNTDVRGPRGIHLFLVVPVALRQPTLLRVPPHSPKLGLLSEFKLLPAAILFELLICLANIFSINNEQVNCKVPLRNYYELGVNGPRSQ